VPLEVRAKTEAVPPLSETEILPVGVVPPVSELTVMVKLSAVLAVGVEVAAVTVVVVPIFVLVLAGQAVARLLRSTEPSPETMS